MPFSRVKDSKGSLELVSLIDMIFILLVFFLVTSFVIHMPLQERKLSIPTPENELGRAQIVLQFINENQLLWLDQSTTAIVEQAENEYGYLGREDLNQRILDEIIQQHTISVRYLSDKLTRLKEQAKATPNQKQFILIRCPNHLPYYLVVQTIASLSDPEIGNLSYGCIGGNLEEIRNCRRIYTVTEKDNRGRFQQNIRIDF